MDYVPLLDQIRSLICRTFAEFGGAMDRMPREAVLIRDGYFCGRRFEADGLHAVWFTEEHEIKFYDRTGAMVRVAELSTERLAPATSARRRNGRQDRQDRGELGNCRAILTRYDGGQR